MYDAHYDLLTYIYLKRNNIPYIKEYCKKIFNENNIMGGIFNLFFMSKQEMKEELDIDETELNLIEMLNIVLELIKEYQIIPSDIKYIVGVEGLDYLNNIQDVETLYKLGVRAVNPVWNNMNKFGAGARIGLEKGASVLMPTKKINTYKRQSVDGLTKQGEKLIEELVKYRIAIDLSHTNDKTFYDIISICKKIKNKGDKPIVFASHSNSRRICNIPRNLTDNQIIEIKKLGGVIGVVAHKSFCRVLNLNNLQNKQINYENDYLRQINYIKNLLGDVESIVLSTDDMRYYFKDIKYYHNVNTFQHNTVSKNIRELLSENGYDKDEMDKIMFRNLENKILNSTIYY